MHWYPPLLQLQYACRQDGGGCLPRALSHLSSASLQPSHALLPPLGSHLQGNKRMRAESFHNCEAGGAGTTTEILSNGGRERRWEERWNLFVGCQGYIRILQRIGTDGVHATMCTQCSRSGGRRLQDGICPETRVKRHLSPPACKGSFRHRKMQINKHTSAHKPP
jgi:hypothetical protein